MRPIGGEVNAPEGREAARRCALAVLAQAHAALGSLDRIVRVVRLGGFINCRPHFAELAPVMNGASDLMVEIFGDAGRHARSTIGVEFGSICFARSIAWRWVGSTALARSDPGRLTA